MTKIPDLIAQGREAQAHAVAEAEAAMAIQPYPSQEQADAAKLRIVEQPVAADEGSQADAPETDGDPVPPKADDAGEAADADKPSTKAETADKPAGQYRTRASKAN